ncbi:MAG: GTP cyclohydrolase II RibA [Rubrivivax sp.]
MLFAFPPKTDSPVSKPTSVAEPFITANNSAASLNGEPAVLAVERAMLELRRGRAIAVVAGQAEESRPLLAVSLEAATPDTIGRLRAVAAGEPVLAITADRARSIGLASGPDDRPTLLRLAADSRDQAIAELGQDWESPARRQRLLSPVAATEACSESSAAALWLAKRAQLLPVVLVATPALPPDPLHVLQVSLTDIQRYERPAAHDLLRVSEARVPLEGCENSRFVLFRDLRDASEHVAVVIGTPDETVQVPVRVHSSCLTGDLFGSLRCDCGEQLRTAVARLAEAGGGVLLYLAQEGRGIGLANKLRAYHLQDAGLDTVDADRHLGFNSDERQYTVAANMLGALGIRTIRLLTNSPHKIRALREAGIDVAGVGPLPGTPNPHNARYIRTKRERAGHLLPDDEQIDS